MGSYLSRRVKKHVGNVKTLFICSGQRVVAEYSSQGGQSYALDKEYVYGSYIDDVVAKVESGNTLYYHSDHQFNVRGLTNSAGAIVELYSYSAAKTMAVSLKMDCKLFKYIIL